MQTPNFYFAFQLSDTTCFDFFLSIARKLFSCTALILPRLPHTWWLYIFCFCEQSLFFLCTWLVGCTTNNNTPSLAPNQNTPLLLYSSSFRSVKALFHLVRPRPWHFTGGLVENGGEKITKFVTLFGWFDANADARTYRHTHIHTLLLLMIWLLLLQLSIFKWNWSCWRRCWHFLLFASTMAVSERLSAAWKRNNAKELIIIRLYCLIN